MLNVYSFFNVTGERTLKIKYTKKNKKCLYIKFGINFEVERKLKIHFTMR